MSPGWLLDDRDRRILALAVPALGTLAIEPLYLLVDTAIVGRLGTVPLAGLALASAVLGFIFWGANFLTWASTTRVAYRTGAGDDRGAAEVAVQSLWLCAFGGVPAAVLMFAGGRPLAIALGGEGAVLEAATTYLRISALGIPALMVALVGQGYFRGRSDTRTPLAIVLAANVLNVILEVVLVYGFDLGVAGSAWGTVAAQSAAGAWFMVLMGRDARAAGASLRVDRAEIVALVDIGRHVVVRTVALVGTLALSAAVAARVDATTLAAHQIGLQLFVFLALFTDALGIAAQAMIGTSRGAGSGHESEAAAHRLVRLGLRVGVGLAVLTIATSPLVPHIFSGDGDVVHTATVAMVWLGVIQLPGSVTFVLDGVLMGAADFRYVKWATVAGLGAFTPFAAAVLAWPDLGIGGIWAGLLAWMTVRTAVNYLRFRRQVAGGWVTSSV